ncbi:MAG: hypothetical protein CMJ32_07730 [Phycisphaerae bacterium]|nr:hypothetical protein [Phycisphaerae bacterium]
MIRLILPTLLCWVLPVLNACSGSTALNAGTPPLLPEGSLMPEQGWESLIKGTDCLVYSLDPDLDFKYGNQNKMGIRTFQGWRVLKELRPTMATRYELAEALAKASRPLGGNPVDCFNPRHGIRSTINGKTYDFVICFQCNSYHVYVDSKLAATVPLSKQPRGLFNATVTDVSLVPGN